MLSINLNQPAAIYLFTFDPFDNNRQLQIIASFMEMDSFRSQVSEEVIWQTNKKRFLTQAAKEIDPQDFTL